MKIITDSVNKKGQRRVIVELGINDQLLAFNEDRFYQLGGQVNDVHRGHVITEAKEVYWCGITQEWEGS